MARDRLAAMRVGHSIWSDDILNHKISTRRPRDKVLRRVLPMPPIPQSGPHRTNHPPNRFLTFFLKISSIQDELRRFDANVSRVSDLHSRSLNNTDDALSQQLATALDELVAETRALSNEIKKQIQDLEMEPVPQGQDPRIRKNQISLVRSKFIEALQNYQQAEQQYRARYRQRVERQFKIVKPDATPEEVAAVVQSDQGAGGQIFAQALTSSTRYGESRVAYREVQERHEDIRKIDRTLAELAQMFSDLDVMIAQQDDTIKAIEDSAIQVNKDTEAGLGQTEKAVVHARSARRKRWFCFFIFLLVLAAVGIAVGLTVGKGNH
ncbi:t-SNARE [Russula earlei]|uniref:t-SNARE n=1 Tax=Russula earlei TaxID=71964 RepID=A0ACC0UGT9_9AGAM|nr:t-SNARE [Russula earlei]